MQNTKLKITLLGTGTSCGVPVVGCNCPVCLSDDPKDKRLRTSAMVESGTTRILIDCGPDFYHQMLRHFRGVSFKKQLNIQGDLYNTESPHQLPHKGEGNASQNEMTLSEFSPCGGVRGGLSKIDAVFISHIHYDHCGGIDDLRPFCVFGDIKIYSNEMVIENMHHTLPYLFAENKYPGIPQITASAYKNHDTITVGDIDVQVFTVNHGKLPISAFRIGNFAYITDMKTIDDSELPYLEGLETLVINALRYGPQHPTHLMVDEAMDFVRKIGAKKVYFTHMCHDIGLHEEVNRKLPEGFELGYDGQEILL